MTARQKFAAERVAMYEYKDITADFIVFLNPSKD
jgi:hypothetical protein